MRSNVIQEIKDNEHTSDEPFVSLAMRIKQFEENIAGRRPEHASKEKEVCRLGLIKHFDLIRALTFISRSRIQLKMHLSISSQDHQSYSQRLGTSKGILV
jgi:hypothetical protein